MKVKKLLVVLLALAAMLSIFILPASAKNNHDQVFTFYFQPNSMVDQGQIGYRKEDASGTYLRYIDGNAQSCMFKVYGGSHSYFESNCQNETKNGYAFVYRGQTGCISQYVYENRYSHYGTATPYAFLQGSVWAVDGGVISSAKGVWSPDTLGSFPYFNR